MTAASGVRLQEVTVRYGDRVIVDRVSLDVRPGEFVCLLGPSGCGKTTTLRSIAGLAPVDDGRIYIGDVLANDLPPHRRGTAMVFQDLALFPHMTVTENIAFGLTLRRLGAAEMRTRVGAMVDLLHLRGLESRFPRQLSGGQQQRVALARSLVVNPAVVLLDEPFAALDRKLREEMRREIRVLQRTLGITTLFVTHDQEEALTMADTVVVMNHGRLEQVGSPSEIYEAPASRFVLSFVGFSNFLRVSEVRGEAGRVTCRLAGTPLTVGSRPVRDPGATGPPELAIRPERIRLDPDGASGPGWANRVPGTVRDASYEGSAVVYDVTLADQQVVLVRTPNQGAGDGPAEATGGRRYRPGEPVILAWGAHDGALVTS